MTLRPEAAGSGDAVACLQQALFQEILDGLCDDAGIVAVVAAAEHHHDRDALLPCEPEHGLVALDQAVGSDTHATKGIFFIRVAASIVDDHVGATVPDGLWQVFLEDAKVLCLADAAA